MRIFGLDINFNKQVITRVLFYFLPMVILAAFIFFFMLPQMEKTIIQEYEGYNKHLLDIIDGQFEKVDEIKANMEKKRFVTRLLYADSTQLYDQNSDVTDFLDFIGELYNINEISSLTSDIGIYNKKNNKVYYTEGINDIEWFFGQTYSIDKKSSGYWKSYFSSYEYENGVQLLGPLEYRYYNVVNQESPREGFLYVSPISIGSSCQLVLLAFIETKSLAEVKNIVQGGDDTYSFLYYNQNEISLNQESAPFKTFDISQIPSDESVKLGNYMVVSSTRTWWNQEFNLVTYISKKDAFKDINTMRVVIGVLLLAMFVYTYAFVFMLNRKQNEINLRKEKKLLINAFMRCCFNWNDESDLQRISEFYGSHYLFVVTEKLNIQDCVMHEGSYNMVIFTCEENTIHVICSEADADKNIYEFLKEYIGRQNIMHFGASSLCKINEIHEGYSQAVDAYDNYSLEGEGRPSTAHENDNSVDYQILNYVNKNFEDSNLSLKDIAERFQINASNISRQFQQATGEHFRSYLMGLRIKKACDLLTQTEDNINTISKLSGYDNPTSFRRIFKQMTGQSPSDYREKHDTRK